MVAPAAVGLTPGKRFQSQASIGRNQTSAGDWIKVLRAGNELQLMGKLAAAPAVSLAQASGATPALAAKPGTRLARTEWQACSKRESDTPLGQLPRRLSRAPRAAIWPQAARQALDKLFAVYPPSKHKLAPGPAKQTRGRCNQVHNWLRAKSGLVLQGATGSNTVGNPKPDLKLGHVPGNHRALLHSRDSGPEAVPTG